MNRWLVPVLIALAAGLGAAGAAQRKTLQEVRREVGDLHARLDRLEGRQKEAAALRTVEDLEAQVARAERKAGEAAAAEAARSSAKPAPAAAAFTEEELQKMIEAKIEEKLQARPAARPEGGGDRKMPLFDLARQLGLDGAAQTRIAAIANTAKQEIFDLLKTPRPDGTSVADEVIAAFMSGDPAAAQKVFGKLFTDKIPGTDTLYVSAVAGVQQKAAQGLAQAMGPEAFGRFQTLNLRPENIETGFDPWQDYLQQRGK